MSQFEAWTVTALGMAVVFIGLVLCIAFIQLFNRIARRITWGAEGQGHGAAAGAAPAPATRGCGDPAHVEPVPADVLAVIAAVLEVESKLYMSRPDSRLTIRRPLASRLTRSREDAMSQHVLRIGGRETGPKSGNSRPSGRRWWSTARSTPSTSCNSAAGTVSRGASAPAPSVRAAAAGRGCAAATRPAPAARGEGGIMAPMPGLVLSIAAKEGDTVEAGQTLLVMEAMKMENAITAPYGGTVSKIYVREATPSARGTCWWTWPVPR